MQTTSCERPSFKAFEGRIIGHSKIENPLREEIYHQVELEGKDGRETIIVAESRMKTKPLIGRNVRAEIDHPIRTLDKNGNNVKTVWEAGILSEIDTSGLPPTNQT